MLTPLPWAGIVLARFSLISGPPARPSSRSRQQSSHGSNRHLESRLGSDLGLAASHPDARVLGHPGGGSGRLQSAGLVSSGSGVASARPRGPRARTRELPALARGSGSENPPP